MLEGRGSLLGTLVVLATAAVVLGINVRIWSDREDDGYSAGVANLDPHDKKSVRHMTKVASSAPALLNSH